VKQFSKILKFEFMGYLKNKVFVGITIFLVAAITVAMFIPNIITLLAPEDTEPEQLPVMLVASEATDISVDDVFLSFSQLFPEYEMIIFTGDREALKAEIIEGRAECAFVIESLLSYTYYVNNLSMYDVNTAIADSALTELYRVEAMIRNEISPEDAIAIMSTVASGSSETLGKDQIQNFFYTYIMIFALYMVIMLYGQMVATNVATEKSSRAMELLVTSTKPVSMMFGKVLASCLAGFSQLVLVFGTAILLFNINREAWGDNPIIESIFNIPVDLLLYLLVFFVLGFLIYAFLYGAIASTASKLEDINTSVMPITFLFIFAFVVVMFSMSSGNVDNITMKICSYVPFTSPMAMFTRIAMSTVAWYEIFISVIILVASTVGVGVLSARIYRVGVLLYGTPPKFTTIIKTVFQKS